MLMNPQRIRSTSLLIIMVLGMLLLAALPAYAQGDAQLCVQAFDDRNANGQLDQGEPPLTQGVSANLLNARGIIIQSILMDSSPNAARGAICFVNLANGQYTVEVTSAEYRATTASSLIAVVTDAAETRTTLFEYGGTRIEAPVLEIVPADTGEISQVELERILIATIGALVASMGSAFIGLMIYLLVLRGRARRAAAYDYDRRMGTGPMQPVQGDTGEYRRR